MFNLLISQNWAGDLEPDRNMFKLKMISRSDKNGRHKRRKFQFGLIALEDN